MNRELKVKSMLTKDSLSPYLNVKDKLIPSVFGCDLSEHDTSFTVSVTSYRRPKMNMVFDTYDNQNLQPKQVVMIQNSDLLHWNSSLVANRKTTYYHIWCSNWNSKFVGKYHPGIMFDTTFNFIFDDDWFIDGKAGFSHIVNTINNNNNIYGHGCAYGIKKPNPTPRVSTCDHIHALVYSRVKHLKLMFQGDIFTYSGGEDIQLCTINYISCRIATKSLSIQVHNTHTDQYKTNDHTYSILNTQSYHNISYPSRFIEYKREEYFPIYDYYIRKGFVSSYNRAR